MLDFGLQNVFCVCPESHVRGTSAQWHGWNLSYPSFRWGSCCSGRRGDWPKVAVLNMVVLENGSQPQCSGRFMSAAFIITKITVVHRKFPMVRRTCYIMIHRWLLSLIPCLLWVSEGQLWSCPFDLQYIFFLLWVQLLSSSLGHCEHVTLLRALLGYHGLGNH